MPIIYILSLLGLILLAAFFYHKFYRKHMRGENAPELSTLVTILETQIVELAETKTGEESQQYWIYVQKGERGPKREFEVGIHYYHALKAGDRGILTYQGTKFLHFALQRDE